MSTNTHFVYFHYLIHYLLTSAATLTKMKSLTYLSLRINKIAILAPTFSKGLVNLIYLDFHRNSLSHIPGILTQPLSSLLRFLFV